MIVLMFAVWISIMIIILYFMLAVSWVMSEEYLTVGVITFIVLAPIGILLSVAFGHMFGVLS